MLTRRTLAGLLVLWLTVATGLAAAPSLPTTLDRLNRGEPVRIVCFGDSVTGVYYHTGSRRAYTDMLGIALQQRYPRARLTMFNAGISGHTTSNGLARIDKDVLAHRPTLVTVMFGLNDMTRVPLDDYRENLRTIVSRCRTIGAEVLLCTPNNVISTSGRPTEKLVQYCEVVREVGRALKVPVCDCYQELEGQRQQDPRAWRLLLSDPIHPNMDGHKRMAELMATAIAGEAVSLRNVPAPSPALPRTRHKIRQRQTIKVLAMTPADQSIGPALAQLGEDVRIDLTSWDVAGKSLAEIDADAKARVRAMKPDLVVLAVPRAAAAPSEEAFIHHFGWIMNWSLNFGQGGWDCLVVHPDVIQPADPDPARDALVRQLVAAQDLHLVDRVDGDTRDVATLLAAWIKKFGGIESSGQTKRQP